MFVWPRKSRSTSGTGGTRRYWWFCLINFWNFFSIHVFVVKKSIADNPTELPCSGDLENLGQLPVQKVLMIVSYIYEKVVAQQVLAYLNSRDLLPKFQSGFRRFHSTESAILRVLSDVYTAAEGDMVSLLALLDVSAAFDTIDHEILMKRLLVSYGFSGQALSWLASFVGYEASLCVARRVTGFVSPWLRQCHTRRHHGSVDGQIAVRAQRVCAADLRFP